MSSARGGRAAFVPVTVVVASFRPLALVESAIAALQVAVDRAPGRASVVLARAGNAEDARRLARGRPWLTVLRCARGATVPELRGAGMREAGGGWTAVTEDHCLVDPDWIHAFGAATGSYDIVGGVMGNARPGIVNWAAYFAEYGFFGPGAIAAGGTPLVTGANVLYAPSVVRDVSEWASSGLWEDVIHARLQAGGARVGFTAEARVQQNGTYSFWAFCRDRFEHGRDYARVRVREQAVDRIPRLLSTPLLPAVLLARVWHASSGQAPGRFITASPITLAFLAAWSAGEAAGYLSGPAIDGGAV